MPKISVFPGEDYGRLHVLRRVENDKRGRPLFECRCSCKSMTLVTVASNALRTHNTESCGCLKAEKTRERIKRYWKKPAGQAAAWSLFKNYQNGAQRRKIDFSLGFSDFTDLVALPCHYCGRPPHRQTNIPGVNGQITYNGLDLVVKAGGYRKSNVVPSCWQCNRARRALSVDVFLAQICRIYEFQELK